MNSIALPQKTIKRGNIHRYTQAEADYRKKKKAIGYQFHREAARNTNDSKVWAQLLTPHTPQATRFARYTGLTGVIWRTTETIDDAMSILHKFAPLHYWRLAVQGRLKTRKALNKGDSFTDLIVSYRDSINIPESDLLCSIDLYGAWYAELKAPSLTSQTISKPVIAFDLTGDTAQLAAA